MQSTYSNIFSASPVSPEDYLQNVQAESHTLSENIDRIHHLERRFFSNLACCESSTFSLHGLVGHYEDEHAALADVRPSPVKALQLNRNPGIAYSQLAPLSHTASPFIDAVQSAYLPGFGQNYDTELFPPDSEFGLVPSTSPVFAREFPEFDQFEGTPPPSSPTPSSPPYSSPSSPSPSSSGSSSFPSTASSSALSSPVCPSAPMLPEVDMPFALASLMGNASIDILPHEEDGYAPSIMRKDRMGVKAQNRSERGVGKEVAVGSKGGKGKAKGAFSAEKAAAKAASKQRREKAYKCPHAGCTKSYLNPNGLKYHLEKGTCCFDAVEPEPSPPPVSSSSAPASLVSSPASPSLSLPASMHMYPYPIASPTPMVPVSSQPPYLSNTLLS